MFALLTVAAGIFFHEFLREVANRLTRKLIGKFLKDEPRLKVDITTFREDEENSRWIIRAAVTNVGKHKALKCEGFWSVFDANYHKFTSSNSVFWVPDSDDDYDYEDKNRRIRDLECNERTYCWIDVDIDNSPIEGIVIKGIYMFPYGLNPGLYYMAIIIEYGQFRSFDFLELNVKSKIKPTDNFAKLNDKIEIFWGANYSLRRLWRKRFLNNFIREHDYHDALRPV